MVKEKRIDPFVTEDKRPYVIPHNWIWVYFQFVINLVSGRDVALSECNDKGIGIPYILGASNIQNNSYTAERWIEKPQVVSIRGDILLSVKGTIGKIYVQKEDAINISRQIMAIRPSSYINTAFTYYYLLSVCEELREASNGLIPGISREDILYRPLPLPPLSEQQRIVDRIESLFAKLDEAKEKAQAVVDGYEERKAAILHKAFSGELTEKWREEHGLSIESWEKTVVGQHATLITKGASPNWQGIAYTKDTSQTLFITSENVRSGYIDLRKEKYIDNKINVIQKRSVLKHGDVLINIVGASIGRSAVFSLHQVANTNQAVCIIRLKPSINNSFLSNYLNSPTAQEYYSLNKVETARANISLSDIKNMPLSLPSIREQEVIVNIISTIEYTEQQAKEAAENVISQIDIMKKAILARAFRGELGTNDPNEEPMVL